MGILKFFEVDMKQFISFLIITVLLSSCGTSSSFSKRKHLKDHFWKKSGIKTGTEKHDISETQNTFFVDGQDELEAIEKPVVLEEQKESNASNEVSYLKVQPNQSRTVAEDSDDPIEETRSTIEESQIRDNQTSTSKNTSPRSKMNRSVGVLVTWLIMGVLGLLFLLLCFILAALDAVGIWMLILGLSLIGVLFWH